MRKRARKVLENGVISARCSVVYVPVREFEDGSNYRQERSQSGAFWRASCKGVDENWQKYLVCHTVLKTEYHVSLVSDLELYNRVFLEGHLLSGDTFQTPSQINGLWSLLIAEREQFFVSKATNS